MAGDSSVREPTNLSLRELKLKPGMFLQTQLAGTGAMPREAQFCAAIAGKGIMLVPLGDGLPPMSPGDTQRVSGFTGIYDFAFEAPVIQLFTYPFPYTLLGYPQAVRATRVRSALRMQTQLPAVVTVHGTRATVPVTLLDLSAAGAMIASTQALGAIGDALTLTFAIGFDGKPVELALTASLAHSSAADDADGFRIGLAFRDVARSDRMALQYFTLKAAEEQATG